MYLYIQDLGQNPYKTSSGRPCHYLLGQTNPHLAYYYINHAGQHASALFHLPWFQYITAIMSEISNLGSNRLQLGWNWLEPLNQAARLQLIAV